MLFTVAAMAQKSIEFTFVVNFFNIFKVDLDMAASDGCHILLK